MDALIKSLFTLAALALCLIPTWIYLLARLVLDPHGFWQKLVVLGLGVWFLGGLQIILIVLFFFLLAAIWSTR